MHAIEKSHYYGFVFLVENRAVPLLSQACSTLYSCDHHNLSFSALVVFFLLPAHLMSSCPPLVLVSPFVKKLCRTGTPLNKI